MKNTLANDLSLPRQPRPGKRTIAPQTRPDKVAIVGFSCRFPGADNPHEFWRLLREGRSAISAFPYWHLPGIAERRHLLTEFDCQGGFIKDPLAFDADFFQISAREAEAMDPQHRVILEQTWAALEDAGIRPQTLRGSDTGVYIGVSSADYHGLLARSAPGAHDATGNAHSIVANRISFWFDFHGPSMPVDTACSSSLVAIHRAAQSILNGDCALAVAGGVNLCFEPLVFLGAAKAGMLSPSGRCKTFSADADGYVRGEGAGVVILKNFQQALDDGDNIVASLIGSAENHGGHANSLTAPNPRAQADLIKQACRDIDINRIDYVEVHGTGTRLGDPVEISGLRQAFAGLGAHAGRRCYLGSVKSNIGHLESAAGVAGVIKTLLAMRHGYLPKSLHSAPLNPYLDLAGGPFEILQEGRAWPRPRCAGISSFGFGGANAHLILEAAEPAAREPAQGVAATLFPVSAKTPAALRSRVEQLLHFIEHQPGLALADLAASLQLGREAMACRLAFSAENPDQLVERLRRYLAGAGDEAGDERLAAWRSGEALDWGRFYPAGPARRVALPTYPFSREVYWIRALAHATDPVTHPLVQRNTSRLAGQRFSSRFDGSEFFFAEHRVNGRKILPGGACLEMARAAIAQSLSDEEALVRLKNIAWLHPIHHDDGTLVIDIELAMLNDGEIRFEILGTDGQVFCRGMAQTGAVESLPPLDVPAITLATSAHNPDPQQCYQIFSQMGLDYGRHFQCIHALQAGNGQVLAQLSLPDAPAMGSGDEEPLRLHPGLLDSALQAALGLALPEANLPASDRQLPLPFALDEAILCDLSLLGGRCLAWVRASVDGGPGRINRMDVDLCDAEGRVGLRLKGFSSRQTDAEPGEPLTLTSVWQAQPLRPVTTSACPSQLILLAGHLPVPLGALAEHCRALVPDRQIQIEQLPAVTYDPAVTLANLAGFLIERLRSSRSDSLVQLAMFGIESELQLTVSVYTSLYATLKVSSSEGLIAGAQSIEINGIDSPQLLAELFIKQASCHDEQVRYLGEHQRQVTHWRQITLPAAQNTPWRASGVYLLTGGTGRLGLLLAETLAREARGARLILVSRSAGQLDAATAGKITTIQSLGTEVRLEALDVADQTAVTALVKHCEQAYGRINGIFHCAGRTRDQLLKHKTQDDLTAVLAPKVAGTLNLDQACADSPLDYFVLFSSIAAVIGNPGQGDYALANAFMDAFAGWRNHQTAKGLRKGRTLAVNWPLWQNGGMRLDPQRQQQMTELTGIRPLSDHSGLELLRRALAATDAPDRLMVLSGDSARIKTFIADQRHAPRNAAATPSTGDELTRSASSYFKQLLSSTLRRPVEKIADDDTFERYGVDSIILTELTTSLEQHFGSLPATLLYEYQTIRELSAYFIKHQREKLQHLLQPRISRSDPQPDQAVLAPPRSRRKQHPPSSPVTHHKRELAIIGLSGRYPGAEDLDAFWHQLANGADLITEVPATRWNPQTHFAPQGDRPDKSYCKWGGFLDGVEDFDPLFFNLSPREAEIINPNDRLFLETCWNLLEGGGLTRQRLKQQYQQQVGVFVGVMYQQYQAIEADLVRESLVSVAGHSAIANRVSYFFDFKGPSQAIDTMCSSAITAIHAAGQALYHGDCRLAIAGGVNLTLHPKKYIGLSLGKVLGSHINSRSFTDGDGYLPAEGVGAVLLKPLADAERDKDAILAVIKSTATNHGGHTHGFSVPSARAQAELIGNHFKRAEIDPRTISYIEAAANGSALGDAIELSALNQVFSQAGVNKQSCAIGSVKSNMGHAEAASGMAQLSKLVLQLQHRQRAPSLLPGPLNPRLDFDNSPFVLQRELADWPRPVLDGQQYPRRAALSAFGAGGSNAHLIIEEYPEPEPAVSPETPAGEGVLHIVPISAKSAASLHQALVRLAHHLDRHPDLQLNALAHTWQTGREAMIWRLALLVKTPTELRTVLAEILRALEQGEGFDALDKLGLPLCFGHLDQVPAPLANLLSGPGAPALSHSLIAADERQQLALLWTQGGEIPWDTLAENAQAKLIPLPGYAFDKQRYWLARTDAATVPHIVTHEEAAGEPGLHLLASLLGMQPAALSLSRPLRDYGADSIVMGQLAMRAQAEIDASLTLGDIRQCVTVGDLLELLAGHAHLLVRSQVRFTELQQLNAVDRGPPIFWFHGALGGAEIYQPLAQRIERPFFGLQARGWMSRHEPLQGLPALAAYDIQAIRSVAPHGPYDLGGYSLGGMLAYEVTRQLQEQGERVTTLVMLDSPDITGERTARLADQTRWLQTVNLLLQMTIAATPSRYAEVLIHRNEIDLSLSPQAYRQQLTALARRRGLKISDDHLQQVMEQGARIQQSYRVEDYQILPLKNPEEVACHYFRNAGGLWMGALEPYFSTDSNEFAAFDHARYWQAWQRKMPDFEIIDVPSSSHMTLLTEPDVFEKIAAYCSSLYARARA